jgi:ribosomal protein S12 methylthiotransferase accessory factor
MLTLTGIDRVLVDAIPYLVDERVGIINTVQEVRRTPGAPNFFHYAAQACNTRAFTKQANFSTTGGASVDRGRAIAKAIGEAIERYCSAIYDVEGLPLARAADAPFECVSPSEFALFTDAQLASPGFPWVPFTSETPVRWTAALDIRTGKTHYVPAAMVYMPYSFFQGSGDSPIVQPISTGMASHTSLARATLAGVYEVIERDAFSIVWQAQLDPPQIRVDTLSDEGYDLVQRFECGDAKVVLFDLTMDHGIPTILSVLRSPGPASPALVFAAAASLDPDRALKGALEELAHTRRYSSQIKTQMEPIAIEPEYVNVVDQRDHLAVYAEHSNVDLANFLFQSKKRIEFDSIPQRSLGDAAEDLKLAAEMVENVGHRALVVDFTSSDVRPFGLFAVRALIPGFHPLFMGHRLRALGGRRLREVPKKLGYPARIPDWGGNPAPHPYP